MHHSGCCWLASPACCVFPRLGDFLVGVCTGPEVIHSLVWAGAAPLTTSVDSHCSMSSMRQAWVTGICKERVGEVGGQGCGWQS